MPEFTDWAKSGENYLAPIYETCSPNLTELRGFFDFLYGKNDLGTEHGYLGCHNNRNIGGTNRLSVHAWGAAIDYRVPEHDRENMLDFLIWASEKAGVQRINDYENKRIWSNFRVGSEDYPDGWKPYDLSANTHYHIEVNKTFHQVRPNWGALFTEYVNPTPPPPPPPPVPEKTDLRYIVQEGDTRGYWGIAEKLYHEEENTAKVTEALQVANNNKDPLYVGDILNLPGKMVL